MDYVRSLFREGRREEAMTELRGIIEREPDNGRPLMALGLAELRGRNLEEAAKLFERAMEVDPDNESPALLAARVGMMGRNPEYSEASFHKALERKPTSVRALTGLAGLHIRNGKPEEALNVLRRAIEMDPQSQILRMRISSMLLQQEKYQEAAGHLEHLLTLNPESAPASSMLARAYSKTGKTDKAQDLLTKAAEVSPKDIGLLTTKADLLIDKEDFADAETVLRKAMALEDQQTAPERVAPARTSETSPVNAAWRNRPQAGGTDTPRARGGQGRFRNNNATAPAAGEGGETAASMIERAFDRFRKRNRVYTRLLLVRALIPQGKHSEARSVLTDMNRNRRTRELVLRLHGDIFAAEQNFSAAEESYRAALHHSKTGASRLTSIDAKKSEGKLTGDALMALYQSEVTEDQKQAMSRMAEGNQRES